MEYIWKEEQFTRNLKVEVVVVSISPYRSNSSLLLYME